MSEILGTSWFLHGNGAGMILQIIKKWPSLGILKNLRARFIVFANPVQLTTYIAIGANGPRTSVVVSRVPIIRSDRCIAGKQVMGGNQNIIRKIRIFDNTFPPLKRVESHGTGRISSPGHTCGASHTFQYAIDTTHLLLSTAISPAGA